MKLLSCIWVFALLSVSQAAAATIKTETIDLGRAAFTADVNSTQEPMKSENNIFRLASFDALFPADVAAGAVLQGIVISSDFSFQSAVTVSVMRSPIGPARNASGSVSTSIALSALGLESSVPITSSASCLADTTMLSCVASRTSGVRSGVRNLRFDDAADVAQLAQGVDVNLDFAVSTMARAGTVSGRGEVGASVSATYTYLIPDTDPGPPVVPLPGAGILMLTSLGALALRERARQRA